MRLKSEVSVRLGKKTTGSFMTSSMTSFARSSDEQTWGSLVWELRSVNHRYFDVTIKLPDELRNIENAVRARLTSQLKRGKVECTLRYKPRQDNSQPCIVNEAYVDEILNACQIINQKMAHANERQQSNVIDILKWPGVLVVPDIDLKPVIDAALFLFENALSELNIARLSEGARLQTLLEVRCKEMQKIVACERARRPQILIQTREKILTKIKDLNITVDQERLAQEMVYLAQKMDVDEELDRLESHFVEIEKILNSAEPIGRRLDFIMQEFNREANTLGSKSTDMQTTQASIDLKVLIEQMREQVQNIE
ncbi:Protein YicC [hydrothermal vent metagenome]|uniref:Protein YicC n=1 Tax=hydrothermal vent metagenome TaxID=652676 RepID=A0A3B0XN59_9ZZZZ